MSQNKLVDLSTEFAVKILNFTSTINGHSSLSNQLERSGTSIGANIKEANYAHGKSEKEATSLLHDCGVIRKLLITSINTAKKNNMICPTHRFPSNDNIFTVTCCT